MTNPHDHPTSGPYGDHATNYHTAGWAPLPLPPHAKKHPPNGYTGNQGTWPSYADVYAWTEQHPDGNIALRLPPHIIGIDVDAYDDKAGGLVLAQLETTHGPLPATWRSTSRDDGTSGIRFYQIPTGLRWPSILGPGIEVIRHAHRYAVAWPSIHPDTDRPYRWITPDGTTTLHDIPHPDNLPHLPTAWVTHFTGGELATDHNRANLNTNQANDWLTAREHHGPCRGMESLTTKAITNLATAGSRHDHTLAETNRLIWTAGIGHTGITTALTRLRTAFKAAATDRTNEEADAEWDRMVTGAIDLAAAAHPTTPPPDPCNDTHGLAGLLGKDTPSAPTATAPTGNGSTPPPNPGDSNTNSSDASTADTNSESPSTVERTTWWPQDADLALDDDTPEPPPTFLTRDDGHALFYPGRVNGIVAPSESGKTWIALHAVTQAVRGFHRVTILDFEDSHRGITGRLRNLGLTKTQIRTHIAYIGPDEPLSPYMPTGRDLTEHIQQWQPALIILDGFNAAMTLQGLDLMSNKDATQFAQTILKPLANNGAAVVYIDHTPKDTENKSAGGIGAQAKRAMTTGCALRVEVIKQFGKGQPGKLRLRVDKDRQGDVRGVSLPGKAGHWAGDFTIEPGEDGDQVHTALHAPLGAGETNQAERPAFRPTGLMERVSSFLATVDDGASRNAVIDGVSGKKEYVIQALDTLVAEGYVDRREEAGRGGARMVHRNVRVYLELADSGPSGSGSQVGPKWVPGPGSSGSPESGSPGPSPYGDPDPLQDPRVNDENPTNPTSGSRIVERVVGGTRVKFNLDTGEIIQ